MLIFEFFISQTLSWNNPLYLGFVLADMSWKQPIACIDLETEAF